MILVITKALDTCPQYKCLPTIVSIKTYINNF